MIAFSLFFSGIFLVAIGWSVTGFIRNPEAVKK
jgi:hypothetical protein